MEISRLRAELACVKTERPSWERRRLTRCKRVDSKYALIEHHRHSWPISVQCRVLRVSAAGYHAHLVRRASDAQRRRLSDEALLVHIKAMHAETRGAYGWPRIRRELVARGVPVGEQRVQKLMQLHGMRVLLNVSAKTIE